MNRYKFFYLLPLTLICIAYGLFLINHRFVIVSGSSMEPVLKDGYITVAVEFSSAEPGNIYMLKEPDNKLNVIKRLVGIPGDTIEIVDGDTYRNGELIAEGPMGYWETSSFTLGPDDYLFIGDNRIESYDGRYWTRYTHLSDIELEIQYLIYPFFSFKDLRVG